MKRLLLLLLGVITLASCRKELNVDEETCFGVRELLHSKNANVKCGERADFENKVICLDGWVEAELEIRNTLQFKLRDVDDQNAEITVTLDSAIADQVANLIRVHGSSRAKVTGVISGFDMPMNLKCKRGFLQHLDTVQDLRFE